MRRAARVAMVTVILGSAGPSVAGPVSAGPAVLPDPPDDGILNPQDMTVEYWARRVEDPVFDPSMCWVGYPALKIGNAVAARKILERCAREGMEGAMPAISSIEENGIDRPSNPAAAAQWDRRLAERGSSVGQLDYGLDLLRGHGVARDPIAGRAMIDRAASGGDETALDLAAHGYDPDSVTPDHDKARYHAPGS